MAATLDALLRLQNVHSKLQTIRQGEESRRRDVRARQKRLDECKAKVDDCHTRLREQQKKIDEVELDTKTREATIAKHRDALNKAKTNREYANILATLNTEKADVSRLESKTLELMTEQDKLKAEKAVLEVEVEKAAQRVLESEAALKEYLRSLGGQIEEFTRERQSAASALVPEILQKFERAADRNDGEAMAPIIKSNPKREEYSCGACHMAVTLQQFSALAGQGELQVCNSCGAILYLGQDLKK